EVVIVVEYVRGAPINGNGPERVGQKKSKSEREESHIPRYASKSFSVIHPGPAPFSKQMANLYLWNQLMVCSESSALVVQGGMTGGSRLWRQGPNASTFLYVRDSSSNKTCEYNIN